MENSQITQSIKVNLENLTNVSIYQERMWKKKKKKNGENL